MVSSDEHGRTSLLSLEWWVSAVEGKGGEVFEHVPTLNGLNHKKERYCPVGVLDWDYSIREEKGQIKVGPI